MPKEQLLGLGADADRLLAAGIGVADGDVLRRRSRTLRDLGKKVPALLPVADAVDRVTGASTPAPAFLDLLVVTRQVRASLATTGVDGALTPLAESGPWQTPVPVRDLYPVREVLTQPGSGREERINDAVERKLFGDLRLVPTLLRALADNYALLADVIAEAGVPALGRGVLPDLLSAFVPNGKSPDARRLRAICQIDPTSGAALCRRMLAEGSPAVRAEALARLARAGTSDETEKAALESCGDPNREVRVAAVSALRVATSDAALNALLAAIGDDQNEVGDAAADALGKLRHPAATERLLTLLEKAVAVKPTAKGEKSRSKSKQAKAPAAAGQDSSDYELRRAARIPVKAMMALGRRNHGDLRAVTSVLVRLQHSKDHELSAAAALALKALGPVSDDVLPTLIAAVEGKKGDAASKALHILKSFAPAAREAAVPTLARLVERKGAEQLNKLLALTLLGAHVEGHRETVMRAARVALADRVLGERFGLSSILGTLILLC